MGKSQEQELVFNALSKINVNDHTETKNGLTYLSWAWAWGIVKGLYPDATYKVKKSKAIINECENELNYFTDGRTCWVEVDVTIKGVTESMYLPVMNYKNQSIPLRDVTSFNINTSIQRCLAKCVAVNFGLGFYIYAGEDVPDEEKEKNDKKAQDDAKEKEIKEALYQVSERQVAELTKYYTPERIEQMCKNLGINSPFDMSQEQINMALIAGKKKALDITSDKESF